MKVRVHNGNVLSNLKNYIPLSSHISSIMLNKVGVHILRDTCVVTNHVIGYDKKTVILIDLHVFIA